MVRMRQEAPNIIANWTVGASPNIFVLAATPVGVQRPCIYRVFLTAVAAATIQFQDTAGNNISGIYNLGVLGILDLKQNNNGDPLFAGVTGRGLQAVVTGTGPLQGDVWVAFGA